MKVFLLMVFSLFSLSAHTECFQSNTKIIKNQKSIENKETICEYEYKKLKFYVSKNCKDKYNQCHALMREEDIKVKNAFSEIGSPGFKLCYALNGSPQIFTFTKGDEQEETDRCILANGIWIEIPLLMKVKNIK